MKKIIIGLMLACGTFIVNKPAVEANNFEVIAENNIVYRVYIEGESVGTLSSMEVYERFLETEMRLLLQEYPEQVVQQPTNIQVIEEISLIPDTSQSDEDILSIIKEKADFRISASVATVVGEDNEELFSFTTSQVAVIEETVFDLMEHFLGKDAFNALTDLESVLLPLSSDGIQYIGVKLHEEVRIESSVEKITDVLSVEESRRFMLYQDITPQEIVVFEEGMSFSEIATEANITLRELQLLNPEILELESDELEGFELDVTPIDPIFTVQSEKETFETIIIPFESEVIEDDTLEKGKTTVVQEGVDGEVVTRTHSIEVMGNEVEVTNSEETVMVEVVNEIIAEGTKEVVGTGTGSFVWPTTSRNVTCGYLCYPGHYAIDIDAYVGQPIFAADGGVVIEAEYNSGYGYVILIDHKNGYYSRYAHLSSFSVSLGQSVQAGQLIGAAGNTGNSSGTHLHFEIRMDKGYQPMYAPNPMQFY